MIFSFWRQLPTREKRFLTGVIALHLVIVTLPYFWAAAITPSGYEYTGVLFSPDDQNVHLSWARQAREGNFFSRNLFTTESLQSGAKPLFFNALTALMGVLAFTGAPLIWIYHALRVLFAAAALLAFYALSTRVTGDERTRVIALLLAAFGGGAQYLSTLFPNRIFLDKPDGNFPMMPEAFTFASSLIFTLNIAAMALLLIVYVCVLAALSTKYSRHATILGFFAAVLLSNIHTYDAIPLILVLLAWQSWQWIEARKTQLPDKVLWLPTAIIIVGAALPILYQLIVFRGSEEFRIKALTPTPAPPIWDVLLSYGFLIPLAVAGGVLAWRTLTDPKQRAALRLLVLWPLVTLLCIYLPVSFARKMIEGLHLPLCLLASLGLIALLQKLPSRPTRLAAAAGVLVLCCASSFQFVWWCATQNTRDAPMYNVSRGELMPPLYLSAGDAAALRFLDTNVSPEDKRTRAVLCWPKLGNYVPRETAMHTYAGHWAETLFMETTENQIGKFARVYNFYSGKMPPDEARTWLRENHIGYVIIGHYERERLGARLPVEQQEIFNQNGTTVFAVPQE